MQKKGEKLLELSRKKKKNEIVGEEKNELFPLTSLWVLACI